MKQRKKTVRNIVFLAVILFIAYLALKDSWSNIWMELCRTSGEVILAVVLCSILYNCFDGIAITKLINNCDGEFPWYHGILCSFYYSFYRVVTFGSGTAAAGMYYVSRLGIPVSKSLGIFTINYIMQRITICLYFVLSFLIHFPKMNGLYRDYAKYMVLGVILAVAVAAALIVICVCEPLHRAAFRAAEIVADKYGKGKSWSRKLDEMEEKANIVRAEAEQLLKDKKLLAEVLLLNAIKLTMWYLIPALLFGMIHSPDFAFLLSVIAMVTALAGVIPAPGGVGAVETVFVLMFTPVVGKVTAASSMLLYRFATYILPFLFGAIVQLGVWKAKKKKAGM